MTDGTGTTHRRAGDGETHVHKRLDDMKDACDKTHAVVDQRLGHLEHHVTDLRLWRARIGGSLAVVVFLAALLGSAFGPKLGRVLWPEAKAGASVASETNEH
jgi:hypothetical protein